MILNINSYGIGKSLLFFHGWGFDQSIWLPLTDKLKKNFTIHLVDLPGFGKTSLMSWDMFKMRLLHQLPEQFAVAGWSLGGLFATRLALEQQQVTHLINIATSPCFIKGTKWPGIEKEILNLFFDNLAHDPDLTLDQFIALQLQNHNYHPDIHYSPSIEALRAGLDVLGNWDLRESLNKLKIPVCYMFGRLDSIVPANTMKIMQAHYQSFDYVLFKKAAHTPFLTHQDEFISELERFLESTNG